MVRPVLVKLGGSILTDKAKEESFQRAAAKRLCGEIRKAEVPTVLLHGAGSFGHPVAARHNIGHDRATPRGVAETLAAVGRLHALVVQAAVDAGLDAVSVPLHLRCRSEGDALMGLPHDEIEDLLEDGMVPVLTGSLVRDDHTGWRVVSADELLADLAPELEPRLAVFATDVDGVYDRHPEAPGATLLPLVTRDDVDRVAAFEEGPGEDVTGRMRGKLLRAICVAQVCPVKVVNGTVRGRLLDILRGKDVPGTRVSP